jgi:catechol-2,3-dioxygenase
MEVTLTQPRIGGLRSIELGVRDLKASADFYRKVWALEDAAVEGNAIHLRGTGDEHHIVTLREMPASQMLCVNFAAPDRATVDALHAKAKAFGATIEAEPQMLPASAGGGYGFRMRTPEGHPMSISSDVARHADIRDDRARPTKLTHVVLNSADVPNQTAFFLDVLGFKLSDSTQMMDFVRCCSDHHSIAFARNNGPTLNHMAYEMPNVDGLMRGAGRLRKNGFDIEWGVGRHGPGDNVFSYFVEPNGFVVEYTTEVQQVDDSYEFHDAKYWHDLNIWPCRWEMAGLPSPRMRHAASGALTEELNASCEQIIARKLGR